MTRWVIKCTQCGMERELDVGFDLSGLRYNVYLYCPRCRMNTMHRVLGYYDPYTKQYINVNQADVSSSNINEFD
ncbi:hypothetical protein [Caldivirga sp. UBA161]|uniref:hypothetical protein n=1 Tax=Caldivirga sp. UBA161 TaxID=1915569 RepID=UPI0025C6D532|nr:hypothetical protein [Caldivirga sp. UBA161]